MNDGDDIESYWKVTRRTLFDIDSPQTSSMGEAICRIMHVLLLYANTMEKLVEADKWNQQGPKVDVRPAPPENNTTIDQLKWIVTIDFPASGLPLPVIETAPWPEEALEKAFNKVANLLQDQVKKRQEEIDKLRSEADGIEEEAGEIEHSCKVMGAYAHRQLNLITQKGAVI
jgi:hypothetical protein